VGLPTGFGSISQGLPSPAMSIRFLLFLVFTLLVALLLASAGTARRAEALQRDAVRAQDRRLASWQLADELRQSSDDLTRLARTFVVTGDARYERWFREVLAIRSGEMPRPEGYSGIYWDFVAAGAEPAPSSGRAVALETLMRELDFSDAEFERLSEARRRSDALVRLEDRAMHAAKGRFDDGTGTYARTGDPDPDLARALMHGEEYHRAKADIMRPIAEFFRLLDERTAREVTDATAAAARFARLTSILTAVAVVTAAFGLFTLLRAVLVPVRDLATRLRDIAEGEGDLTRRVDERRRNEFGELARWFNRFAEVIRRLVRDVAGTSNAVAASATQIAATAREQQAAVGRIGVSTRQVAVAVREIDATGHDLLVATEGLRDSARASAAAASGGRAGLDGLDATMRGLHDASESVAAKFATLAERTRAIDDVVHAIMRVAAQTNLLSINAELEATKAAAAAKAAGLAGAGGFGAVAREIRLLADRTATAALDIENDVRLMRTAMAEGHSELGRLDGSIRAATGRVSEIAGGFGKILDEVQASTGRFEALSSGIDQQTAGIRQITEAIASLEDTAGDAGRSLTEFVDAADRLRDATQTLRSQVDRFRTDAPA